jgi:hypothetical protein
VPTAIKLAHLTCFDTDNPSQRTPLSAFELVRKPFRIKKGLAHKFSRIIQGDLTDTKYQASLLVPEVENQSVGV